MRILQIRFKNLNSLTGEWSVDFTHPAYTSDGIFAITGPTGAGKTTILDAICLALYGRTPRLNRVTKRSNEVMSRQTGDCFAEVVFETPAGHFRCHWSQHRARRRPAGELQPPRHEIAEADSGKILQSRIRDTSTCIEAATGMDFQRFTRSMLLAQGEFAAFLQAPPDERAPILEQITGTEIYSRISTKVHQRFTEERKNLDMLEAELDGLRLLSEDEQHQQETLLTARNTAEKDITQQVDDLKNAVSWRERLGRLEKDLEALEKQQHDLEQRQKAFEPQKMQLARAQKALSLEGPAARAAALGAEQEQESAILAVARRDLPELEAALAREVRQKQAAGQKHAQSRVHQKARLAIIRKVREIDVRIENQRSRVQTAEDSVRQTQQQSARCLAHVAELQASLKTETAALDKIDRYLRQHATDGGLVENMTAIGRMFDALGEKNTALVNARKALQEAMAETAAAAKAVAKQETAHRRCRSRQQQDRSTHEQLVETVAKMLGGRQLSDWRGELETLKERKGLLEKLEEILQRRDRTDHDLSAARLRRRSLDQNMAALTEKVSRYEAEKASREKEARRLETHVALLARIRDLEAERRHLEDGRPCPLCGATEHPFAAGNIPVMDDAQAALARSRKKLQQATDRLSVLRVAQAETQKDIRQVEEQLAGFQATLAMDAKQCDQILSGLDLTVDTKKGPLAMGGELAKAQERILAVSGMVQQIEEETKRSETLRKSLDAAREACIASERALQDARHRQDTARREHRRLKRDCRLVEKQVEHLHREVLETVQAYGVGEVSVSGLDSLFEDLKKRYDKWQKRQKDRREHEKRLAGFEKEAEKQRALLDQFEAQLRDRHREHAQVRRQLAELDESRRQWYGDKHPDQEEKRLADGMQAEEKALEQSRQECARMEQALGRLKEKVTLLTISTRQRAGVLAEARQNLAEQLKKEGFKDENDFRAACLTRRERDQLLRQDEALGRENAEIRARLEDKRAALRVERMKKITEKSIQTLCRELEEAEAARREVQQEIGAIKDRLAQNRKQRTRRQEHLKNLEIQKKECVRWDTLHRLIGSADGKKYRNFAQGLTFEFMIVHANRQLYAMTDRYLLIRDEVQPLELNVIDNYQAGEIRSTKNLSGGESFIVSLALALGLSQMASHNVRVDSLFLDEGFGTLDEDSLETALETLAGLQQAGKLIGVISHVPALKERISTQIQVMREAGGRSRIRGPGCAP